MKNLNKLMVIVCGCVMVSAGCVVASDDKKNLNVEAATRDLNAKTFVIVHNIKKENARLKEKNVALAAQRDTQANTIAQMTPMLSKDRELIIQLSEGLEQETHTIESLTQDNSNLAQLNEELKRNLAEAERVDEKSKEVINAQKKLIDEKDKELSVQLAEMSSGAKELEDIIADKARLEEENRNLKNSRAIAFGAGVAMIADMEKDKKIEEQAEEIKKLRQTVKRLNAIEQTVGNRQIIAKAAADRQHQEISRLTKEQDKNDRVKKEQEQRIENLKKKLQTTVLRADSAEEKNKDLANSDKMSKSTIEELERRNAGLQEKIAALQRQLTLLTVQFQATVKAKEKELAEARDEIEDLQSELATIGTSDAEFQRLQERNDELERQLADLNEKLKALPSENPSAFQNNNEQEKHDGRSIDDERYRVLFIPEPDLELMNRENLALKSALARAIHQLNQLRQQLEAAQGKEGE